MGSLGKLPLVALLVTCALITAAHANDSAELSAALDALHKGNCERLGSLVNEGLDSGAAMKLVAGLMHEEGLCVSRDFDRAQRYYAAADSAKDWQSSIRIGLSYALGDSVARSYSKAGAWLSKSLEQQGKGDGARKLLTAKIPSAEVSPLTEWNGYLISVYYLGSRLVKYPTEAQRSGAEGVYRVKVCLADGVVTVQPVKIEPGPAAGVARYSGARELTQAIENAYERAIRALPPPSSAAPHQACFENSITFRLGSRS